MKAIVLFLIFVSFSCSNLFGQDVIKEEVIANAQRFLQKREGNLKSAKPLILTKFLENKTNKNQLYIHNVGENQGWIITEKIDDKLFVLGYSLTGSFDYDKSVPYVRNWLSVKLDSVSSKKSAKATQNSTQEYYRLEPFLKTKDGELIQWNQFPNYNQACPVVEGEKTPVGCVPTALGQLMRYWEFPNKSRGAVHYDYTLWNRNNLKVSLQHSFGDRVYNWDKMPVSLTESSTGEEKKEISELLFDVGLASTVFYDLAGSSTGSDDMMKLNGYFNYKRPTKISLFESDGFTRKAGADSVKFHSQIIDNLEKKYPVIVIGFVWGGFHAMVCDGYDNEGFYHLNYGWGGQSDGYYNYSEESWCGIINQPYTQYLFVDAFIGFVPSELSYSCSVVEYHPVVKPAKMDSLVIQIEEDDRSCPFYFKPKLFFKKANETAISPDITFSVDTANAMITINYLTPDEGIYDLMVNFTTKRDTIFLNPLGLKVDNYYEDISEDIQIASIKSVNNFDYISPTISLSLELQNKSIQLACNVKSELISDQGAVEYSSVNNFNLSGNSTQIEIEIPLQDIIFGNKQLKISIDNDHLISETDESNNSITIPMMFNREIPLGEWDFLKTLYTNCGGEMWKFKENWISNSPISSWQGVTVNENHIIELTNSFNVYDGAGGGVRSGHTEYNTFDKTSFPEKISNLSQLKVIDLAFSESGGTSIPQSITKLDSLKTLKFYHCGLSGPIPDNIGDLKNLEELIIDENNLTGTLPSSVFDLKKLKMLRLSWNPGLSGNIDSIGKLQNLTFIQFMRTQIGGRFPEAIFNLPHLREFMGNDFQYGPIPIVERTNETLLSFFLSNSKVEGNILKTLIHCNKLRNLELSNNKFSGEIPDEFWNLKELRGINLNGNNFTGSLPPVISNLTYLLWLNVSNNHLTGHIPKEISELKKVWDLDFSNNKFEELEPVKRDFLPGLRLFKVENNKLEFQSFENNPELLKEDFFTFSPQDSVGENFAAHISPGEDFNYQFTCGGSNNHYQWLHNGTTFGEASNNGDLVLENASTDNFGKYVCKITNSLVDQLTLYSKPVYLSIGDHMIINNSESINSELIIYPNPISSGMPLRISGLNNNWSTVKITDMFGKVVYREPLNQHEDIQMKEIDISLLKMGIYIIQFENKEESIANKFVVI
jgi:hypothetical protein